MSVVQNHPTQSTRTTLSGPKARLAKQLFVGAAFISFLFSVSLWFSDYREEGVFVGLWVPSILSLGSLVFAGQKA